MSHYDEVEKYNAANMQAGCATELSIEAPTVSEANNRQIQRLEEQLKLRKELKELLKQNPEIEKITTLMGQLGKSLY